MITLAAADTINAIGGTATAVTYTIFGLELTNATGAETYKRLAQGQLALAAGALYTVPAGTTAFVKQIVLANATGSAVSGIILYVGGTAAANQITGSFTIPANGVAIFDDAGMQVYDANGNLFCTGPAFATPSIVLGTAAAPGAAATGIRSDATLLAFDATVPSITLPGTVLGSVGVATVAARRDHQHQSPGGITAMTSGAGLAIANTETQVVGQSLASNFLKAITSFRFCAAGVATTTGAATSTFRIRIGSTTLTGNIPTSLAVATLSGATAVPFSFDAVVTCRTNIAAIGECSLIVGSTTLLATIQQLSNTTATVAITANQSNVVELTFISGATTITYTFHVATMECMITG